MGCQLCRDKEQPIEGKQEGSVAQLQPPTTGSRRNSSSRPADAVSQKPKLKLALPFDANDLTAASPRSKTPKSLHPLDVKSPQGSPVGSPRSQISIGSQHSSELRQSNRRNRRGSEPDFSTVSPRTARSPVYSKRTPFCGRVAVRPFHWLSQGFAHCYKEEGETCGLIQAEQRNSRKKCLIRVTRDTHDKALKAKMTALRALDHPFLLALLEIAKDERSFYEVYEQARGGTAEGLLTPTLGCAPSGVGEKRAACIMRQVFAALCHCAEKGVSVSWLSLKHVWFDDSPSDSSVWIKLLPPVEDCPQSPFAAPEVQKKTYSGPESAMWSCGVILSNLLIGTTIIVPKSKPGSSQGLLLAYRRWNAMSAEAKELSEKLLARDYRLRPSAQQCLQHPWVTSLPLPSSLTPNLRAALRSLVAARPQPSLKTVLLQLIVRLVVSGENLRWTQEVFREIDTDVDGFITEPEVRNQLSRLFSEAQVQAAMSSLGTGLSFSEFQRLASGPNLLSIANLTSLFNFLDPENSGQLSAKRLSEVLTVEQSSSAEAWKSVLSHLSGADTVCEFSPFCAYMLSD